MISDPCFRDERPVMVDLFCGAGGAATGYVEAGFTVVGVDASPQPHFPFGFVQADWADGLDQVLSEFPVSAVHASPPCQRYSTLKTVTSQRVDLVAVVRERLMSLGVPYVIENVMGAPLVSPMKLCGTTLGCVDDESELRRHRLFECSFPASSPGCDHRKSRRPLGVYGHLGFEDRPNRPVDGPTGPHGWKAGKVHARELMGVDWPVTDHELGQAIPPAYTEHIGRQLLEELS